MSSHDISSIEGYVQAKIASGQFASREELADEAIRVYRELETRHAELREQIGRRIASADRGEIETWDIEQIKAEGRRRLAQSGGSLPCQE